MSVRQEILYHLKQLENEFHEYVTKLQKEPYQKKLERMRIILQGGYEYHFRISIKKIKSNSPS